MESQLGSVQQGDGPLQLQSPLPGVSLPQYQPDPSLPATRPGRSEALPSEANIIQDVTAASAASNSAAAGGIITSAAMATDAQPDAPAAKAVSKPSKHETPLHKQSFALAGSVGASDKPGGQDRHDGKPLNGQARRSCSLPCHECFLSLAGDS